MNNAPKNQNKIAVILPCFNEERYLDRVMPTLLAQDFDEPWDLWLSDHSSTDRTLEKLQNWKHAAELNSHCVAGRINKLVQIFVVQAPKVTKHDSIGGFNEHVNWLMQQISAEFVIVSTADDEECLNRVREHVKAWRETGADFVTSSQHFVYPDGTFKDAQEGVSRAVSLLELVAETAGLAPSTGGASSWSTKLWREFGPLVSAVPNDLIQPIWGALRGGTYHIGMPMRTFYYTGRQTGIGAQYQTEENPVKKAQLLEIMRYEHMMISAATIDLLEKELSLDMRSSVPKEFMHCYAVAQRTALSRGMRWLEARNMLTKHNIPPRGFDY